jgi:hypothetical protein
MSGLRFCDRNIIALITSLKCNRYFCAGPSFFLPSVGNTKKVPNLRPAMDAAIRMAMHADIKMRPESVGEFVRL